MYYEIERQQTIADRKDYTFIRINPSKEGFNMAIELGRIQNHIIESTTKLTKESTKNALIDCLSKIILELEFKKHKFIHTKCIKYIFKKTLPAL